MKTKYSDMSKNELIELIELLERKDALKNSLYSTAVTPAELYNKDIHQDSREWLENSPICTKILDTDFNILYMSSTGVTSLNLDNVEDYYGKPYPFEFYPESFKDLMNKKLSTSKASGKSDSLEASVTDINGNELWYQSTITPIKNQSDNIMYFIVISIEITAQKNAEKEKNDAYEKSTSMSKLATIGKISATIAHEINNPLSIAISFNTLIKELIIDSCPPKNLENLKEMFNISDDALSKVLKIVNGIKSQSNLNNTKLETINLKEFLEKDIELFSGLNKNINFELDIKPENFQIITNKMKLDQVISNLLTNAMMRSKIVKIKPLILL